MSDPTQPDHRSGVMLCVKPEDPERFSIPGGTPVDEIHCTLMYFGKTDTFDGPAAEQAREVLASEIAPEYTPLQGEVTAYTVLKGGDDGPALVLLVDAPGLCALRTKAFGALSAALGEDTQPYENHDFLAHITMCYGPDAEDFETAGLLVGQPLFFDSLHFVWGEETSSYSLGIDPHGGSIPVEAGTSRLPLDEEIASSRTSEVETYAQESGMTDTSTDPLAIVIGDHDERLAAVDLFLAMEPTEFAPFPPKKKKDEEDPEDKAEAPETPGEKPDAEDKKEAPEPDAGKKAAPFPPKKDDGDPEDKAEAPEKPGEAPDAEDKKEAPEGDKPAPPPPAAEKKAPVPGKPIPTRGGPPPAGKPAPPAPEKKAAPPVAEKPVPGEKEAPDAPAGDAKNTGPVPKHDSETVEGAWNGPEMETKVREGEGPQYYDEIYAWADPKGDPGAKSTYKFIHHEVADDGTPGAANVTACQAGIAVLNGARTAPNIPPGDVQGVYDHLAAHLKAAGVDVPPLGNADAPAKSENSTAEMVAEFGATPVHHTETYSDANYSGNEAQKNTRHGESAAYYDKIYAWYDPTKDPSFKTAYSFPHHKVSTAGDPGPACVEATRASLMLIEDSGIPEKDYQGVYNHLAAHLKDAGVEVPDLGDDNASIDDIRSAVLSIELGDEVAEAAEETKMAAPSFDITDMDDAALVGEFMRRYLESLGKKGGEVAKVGDSLLEEAGAGGCPQCGGTMGDCGDGTFGCCAECGFAADGEAPMPGDEAAPAPMIGGNASYEWEGVLIPEGVPSGDGRMIEAGALTHRDLPLPLMLQTQNAEGHSGAVICGSIQDIERVGNDIVGRGNFDSGPAGEEARRLLTEGTMRGVSADIDSVVVDLRDENGNEVPMEDVLFGGANAMEVLVAGRIMGATLTPFPAFQEASIQVLDGSAQAADEVLVASGGEYAGEVWRCTFGVAPLVLNGVHEPFELKTREAIVASGGDNELPEIPVNPPTAWFLNQDMDEPVPFTVFPDGRCFGLVAKFGTCHIGFRDRCVDVPKSFSNYRYFRNKSVVTAEGQQIATGPIFMDTVHPSLKLRASDTQAHYADTGCAVADVALYENEFGIVAAGAVRSDATPEQIRALRGSDISPDWRSIDRRLEVVGLLAVNVSGFIVESLAASAGTPTELPNPVRARINTATDEVEALVAAGSMRKCASCGGDMSNNELVASIAELLADHSAAIAELKTAIRPYRIEQATKRIAELAALTASATSGEAAEETEAETEEPVAPEV